MSQNKFCEFRGYPESTWKRFTLLCTQIATMQLQWCLYNIIILLTDGFPVLMLEKVVSAGRDWKPCGGKHSNKSVTNIRWPWGPEQGKHNLFLLQSIGGNISHQHFSCSVIFLNKIKMEPQKCEIVLLWMMIFSNFKLTYFYQFRKSPRHMVKCCPKQRCFF